jgi:Beta-lactamase
MLDRRQLLLGAAALAAGTATARAATTLANSLAWETAAPADAGFVPDLEARLDQFVQGGVGNLHGVVVARHGRLVLEKYYEGEDMLRDGRGGVYPELVKFSAERLHEVRSITKSMVSLLYGIALRDGKVPSPDAPLLAQFPQYADIADREQRSRWTIAHALTMTLGIEWNEDISYDDPRNGQTAMEAAADRYRYVLERPIVTPAGERWNYCGGATALIGKILENGTGQKAHDYAGPCCLIRSGLGRPSGASAVTVNLTSLPALRCGRGIWRGSGRCCSIAATPARSNWSRRIGSTPPSSRQRQSASGVNMAITGISANSMRRQDRSASGGSRPMAMATNGCSSFPALNWWRS